jgi:hypothetical protein
MGLRLSHGTWQWVEDPKHPPAFTPAEAAKPSPPKGLAAHGAVGESRQGTGALRGRTGVGERLWPHLRDPPGGCDAGPQQAGSRHHLVSRDVLVVSRRPAPNRCMRSIAYATGLNITTSRPSMNWAGPITRCGGTQAIVRHWHLVMLAFTFSLLMGSPPAPQASTTPAAPLTTDEALGEKRGTRRRETAESPPQPCVRCAHGSVRGPVCSSDDHALDKRCSAA